MSLRRSRQSRKRKNATARKKAMRRRPPTVASVSSSDSTTTTAATSAMSRNPRSVAFMSVKKVLMRFTNESSGKPGHESAYGEGVREEIAGATTAPVDDAAEQRSQRRHAHDEVGEDRVRVEHLREATAAR